MKILLIIIDGLGDKVVPQLGNKTPLESARTPNFDFLSANGISGLVVPFCEKGKLPTSEDTHLALFGYNPAIFNPGRGVLEVLGLGMKVSKHDVCLRGNFATLGENLKIIDRRAGRIKKTEELIKAISVIEIEGVKFLIKKAVSHRVGIVMRGDDLSPRISDGDPKKVGVRPLKIVPREKSREAVFTARIFNEFLERCRVILKKHPLNRRRGKPANFILVRGAGSLKEIPFFRKKYKMKACCIAGGALYKGIGKFLGMDIIKIKGANALPTTNLREKFNAVKKALEKYDFVFCHIKAADNLAEDGDFRGKKDFIEKIDKNLTPILLSRNMKNSEINKEHEPVGRVRMSKIKNTLIVITADHSTCSILKRHCLEPIPILIYSKEIRAKEEKKELGRFSEKACKKGKLGKINQLDLLPVILQIARK